MTGFGGSNLGPTQSRISPSTLQYSKIDWDGARTWTAEESSRRAASRSRSATSPSICSWIPCTDSCEGANDLRGRVQSLAFKACMDPLRQLQMQKMFESAGKNNRITPPRRSETKSRGKAYASTNRCSKYSGWKTFGVLVLPREKSSVSVHGSPTKVLFSILSGFKNLALLMSFCLFKNTIV